MVEPDRRSERYRPKNRWWPKVQAQIDAKLSKCPLLHRPVKYAWRTCHYLIFRCRLWLVPLFNRTLKNLEINATLFVSPEKIVYSSLSEFNSEDFQGDVIGGDWDRLEKRFEDLDVYVAFKQVFIEGKNWTETIFYQRHLDAIKKGEFIWGCANENDLQQRCKNLDKLFQTIKREGYKSQRELLQSSKSWDPLSADDEITISIGRNGDLLYSQSAHRLAIAKLLHIKQVPVKIAVRHTEWVSFVRELWQYAKTLGGVLYQPLTHPDLMNFPTAHKCEDRFRLIKENMSTKNGLLLDIGANLGYFCHKFEDEGFECYAVENSEKELYFLRKLRRAENRKFRIMPRSIFEEITSAQLGADEVKFDVVLALNVFHHALKTEESYNQLVALLQTLQMGELFFEPALENDPQMRNAYRNYSPEEFVNFIMQVSTLKKARLIGKASDGRPVYRLSP